MKKFAFFLPQFHEIEENNIWWGKGFTEWRNVKAAKPLFKEHKQPKEPLNDNYYCLTDKKTVIWQTKLANDYGIDGLIYYHYYFDGKLLLEKPAENLLDWNDIDQKFFFCWANHTWNRAWEGKREVLLEQKYGNKESWEKHFYYLLPFFKDKRYEKVGNKPVFMLFDSSFPEKKQMMELFNSLCIKEGFNGIFVIETYKGENWPQGLQDFENNRCSQCEKILLRESTTASNIFRVKNKYTIWWFKIKIQELLIKKGIKVGVKRFNGNDLYNVMINEEPYGKGFVHSLFFEWDNTPRHGYRGFIITPPDKEIFDKFMEKTKNDDYLFINAWNEWAEGMVLEPTKENEYKYLEWISEWKK